MTSKKQQTKPAAPEPKGFSWGETQTGIKSSDNATSIKSPRDAASGQATS